MLKNLTKCVTFFIVLSMRLILSDTWNAKARLSCYRHLNYSSLYLREHLFCLVFSYWRVERLTLVSFSQAYVVGLLVTFAVMLLSGMGQPALLYLVPFTLITSAAVAGIRREMKQFWAGTPYEVSGQWISFCLCSCAVPATKVTMTFVRCTYVCVSKLRHMNGREGI